MYIIAKKLNKLADSNNINYLNHDSTPIESSRYSYNAKYNPHYECRMYKAHITMKGTIPLLMTFSNGINHDSPYLEKDIHKLKELNITAKHINLDSAYDSFENYALCAHVLKAYPNIALPSNAVINEEGCKEEIQKRCQKLWKKGGYKAKTIDEQLEFLFNNRRIEQVGMYYRNQNLKNGLNRDEYRLRSRQEMIHKHIKTTVKFDSRGLHRKTTKLNIMLSFVSYQLLVLCAMQNRLNPNSFGFVKYN